MTPEPCRHCREAESAHRPTHARGMAATALSTPTEYDLRHEEARKVERMRCLVAGDRCYDNKDGVQVRGWRARVDGQVQWAHRAGVDGSGISSELWMSVEVSPIGVVS